MPHSRRTWLTCASLFLASLSLSLVFIQFPETPNFDEFHYVPSAKQWLALSENQNWEHPPLAKQLIAVGIALAGDRPLGWRLMSAVFGALTLVGMYAWAMAVFRRRDLALWAALLTLCNHLLYVQSRIAMLDTFMFAFLVWALAAFSAAWSTTPPIDARRLHRLAGLLFGLAVACKWAAIVVWAFVLALVGMVWLLRRRRIHTSHDWLPAELGRDWSAKDLILAYGAIPVAAYFATFIPYFFVKPGAIGLWDLIKMQATMWDGQLRVVKSHPYMSSWMQWPLLSRPIWYAFDKVGDGRWVRGVLLLGNPIVMWAGIVAWIYCVWAWITERSRDAFLISVTYGVLLFGWAVIPRKIAFYYYYYPAGMTLSLALAFALERWPAQLRWAFLAISAGVFAYFYPILAGLKIPVNSFRDWMWLSSWI